jgi:hypothetical protein
MKNADDLPFGYDGDIICGTSGRPTKKGGGQTMDRTEARQSSVFASAPGR